MILQRTARLFRSLARFAPAFRLALALAAVALILLPAELWSEPSRDLSVAGFDRETVHVDERGGRYIFAPFQVLTNGDWRACPCAPASHLVLTGSDLSPVTRSEPEGVPELGGVSVTVDGRPTRVYAVSPGQINFFLRADATPPVSTIRLLHDGREIGQQSIPVTGSPPEEPAGVAEVTIEPDQLLLSAAPASQPSVHLLTTPLSFEVSFDIIVQDGASGRPFQAMLWNPRNFSSISLIFGPPPEQHVEAVVSENRGKVTARRGLGRYEFGQPYHVEIALERNERVELGMAPGQTSEAPQRAVFTPEDAPGLFDAYRPTLTVLSHSVAGTTDVALSNYRLDLPHDRFLSVRVDDAKILPLALVLLGLSAALHAPLLLRAVRRLTVRPRSLRLAGAVPILRRWWWLAPAVVAVGAGAGSLMMLGSHPFDMAAQKIWIYLLINDDIGDLYYRAQTVPVASIWNGMPFHEAVFPYGVSMSYYFYAVGWVHQLLGGDVTPSSTSLETTIKAANFLVAIADAALLMILVRGMGHPRLALLVPLAFLLNPAMLFDIAVWGETEPIALFFLLASMVAAQRSSARWAWTLLALAFLGKQTVVLPAFLIGIYYLRLFPVRRSLEGLSLAAPAVMLAVLPYIMAGYPPSIAIDPIWGVFRVFGGSEMEKAFQVVSFDAYSIWPLVTLLWNGQHGLARLQYPDSASFLGLLSYHQLGMLAFLAVIGALAVWLLTSRRVGKEPGLIFVVLAFATLAELVLPTRAIARYQIFPLVFVLLASARAAPRTMWFVAGAVTVTSLVGMYGSVASGIESMPSLAPRLAPANNVVSAAALALFRSDLMITLGSLLNVAALLLLAATLWLPRRVFRTAEWRPTLRAVPVQANRMG